MRRWAACERASRLPQLLRLPLKLSGRCAETERMAVQESPELGRADELDELDRLEATLLAQLRELKSQPGPRDPSSPSVAYVEERLIEIHGRKSTLRTSRPGIASGSALMLGPSE